MIMHPFDETRYQDLKARIDYCKKRLESKPLAIFAKMRLKKVEEMVEHAHAVKKISIADNFELELELQQVEERCQNVWF